MDKSSMLKINNFRNFFFFIYSNHFIFLMSNCQWYSVCVNQIQYWQVFLKLSKVATIMKAFSQSNSREQFYLHGNENVSFQILCYAAKTMSIPILNKKKKKIIQLICQTFPRREREFKVNSEIGHTPTGMSNLFFIFIL